MLISRELGFWNLSLKGDHGDLHASLLLCLMVNLHFSGMSLSIVATGNSCYCLNHTLVLEYTRL